MNIGKFWEIIGEIKKAVVDFEGTSNPLGNAMRKVLLPIENVELAQWNQICESYIACMSHYEPKDKTFRDYGMADKINGKVYEIYKEKCGVEDNGHPIFLNLLAESPNSSKEEIAEIQSEFDLRYKKPDNLF